MQTPDDAAPERSEVDLFHLMVDNVRDYAIFVLDAEGLVRSWNPGAERLLGWREDEILGQPWDVFFTPEDRQRNAPRQEMEQARIEGRSHADRWHVRKDGTRFWSGSTVAPLWDDRRRLTGYAKILHDQTHWRRAEEERAALLARKERRKRLYEAALSNTPDLVYVLDLDHRFVYANERLLQMLGRTWDETIGKTWLELGYERWHAEAHDREIEQVITTKQPVKGEMPFTGTFGRRHYEYIVVPVLGPDGEVEAVVGTNRDVTERRQAEEQVRHNEERFRSLMEQAPFSIQVFGPDGRTILVNRAWEELWGVRLEQVANYNILDDRQLDARGVLPIIKDAFAGRAARIPAILYDPSETIPGFRGGSDARRWLSAVIYPIKDAGGRVREVVLIQEDVTARKRVEDDLRESEERFRATFDRAAVGVAHVGIDQRTLWVNPGLCEMLGYTEAELRERSLVELTHPDDLEADLALGCRLLGGEIPSYRLEKRFFHKDGSIVWTDLAVSVVRDAAGEVKYVVGVFVDVTARKQAEARLEAVLAGITDHLACYDRQWRFTFVNDKAAQLLGKRKEDLLGRSIWDVFPDAIGNQYWREVHQAMTEQRVIRSEHYYPKIDAWFENHIYPTREGLIVFSADVTWRKRLEDELRRHNERLAEADRRKDEFLATLAHELRNPLAPIRNSLQILAMPDVDATTAQHAREMMERQVRHLVRLVDDLLDVSRVMRGKIELRREPIEIASVVARGIETAQPLIQAQGHELQVTLPDEPLLIDADPVRVAQVVANLLTNAAKYTPPHGHIAVSVRAEGGAAVLTVRDDGIGIAPDMLSHVFELFVQGDHAAAHAQGGLGIGLTLVKNLVEMHRGTVEARSEGHGKGSEFVVRLPLMACATDADKPADHGDREAQPQVKRWRLLVVDDNEDAAESLALLLRLQGHDVVVAHDGPAALAAAARHRPQLVFLDLGMPGMDGYEVARRLRRQPGLGDVIVVALTGWGQEEDRKRTSAAGFDHHLVKPPEPSALEAVLATLVSRD